MSLFYVGQHVICINNAGWENIFVEGHMYTVEEESFLSVCINKLFIPKHIAKHCFVPVEYGAGSNASTFAHCA